MKTEKETGFVGLRTRHVGAFLLVFALTGSAMASDASLALREAGMHRGLCLHLGCGQEGTEAMTAGLAADSDMLVHGLALDVAACKKARQAVRDAGMQGVAQVEVLDDKRLPYVDALADLIVVEDLASLGKAGISTAEIERVLALGGVMLVRQGESWSKTTKSWPKDVGQWTHPGRGPDGNRVTTEKIPFPVGLRWQDGLPINIGHWASNRSWVAARGRVFSISMSEVENIEVGTDRRHKRQWLIARSAANGLPHWKIPLETTDDRSDLTPLNTLPLATDGQLVLCRNKGGLVAVAAESGKVVHSYPVSFRPVRLALAEGMVIVAGWGKVLGRQMWDANTKPGSSLWDLWTPAVDKGAVEAFNVETGERVWEDPVAAQTLLISGNSVVYLVQGPAPVKQQSIVARDLATGRELWRVPHDSLDGPPTLFLAGVGEGVVVLARHKPGSVNFQMRCNQVMALSLKDGAKLWQADGAGDALAIFANGELWYGSQRYAPTTGKVLGKTGLRVTRGMCVPPVLIGGIGGAPRGGRWADLDKEGSVTSGGVRGACIQGVAVAEGRMYIAQNWCRCAPGQVPGFLALGSEAVPSGELFSASRPVVRGTGQAEQQQQKGACWGTLRGNGARSGACDFAVPTRIEQKWQTTVAEPSDHRIAKVWAQSLQARVSAPVANGNVALVAACNQGSVVALGLDDGKERWRSSAGARMDSPPTLHGGLCLAASHDGWVHAFSSADGALVWRTRIAPREKRLVAFGQVESTWPAVGSPLVHDGVGYAVAGRATEMEGGCAVVAFDPATGATRWASRLSGNPSRRVDVLQWRDDALLMQNWRIAPSDGTVQLGPGANKRSSGNLDGLLDGSWYYVGNRRSGKHRAGKASGEVLAWDASTWFGFSIDRHLQGCFAISRDAAQEANPKDAKSATYLWKGASKDLRVTALALAKNALVVAGSVNGSPTKGLVRLLSRETGDVLAEVALTAPTVAHGIALTPENVIVSLMDGSVACLGSR